MIEKSHVLFSEIVNDVLRAVRDYYDSEYVYYIVGKSMGILRPSLSGVQRMFHGREIR